MATIIAGTCFGRCGYLCELNLTESLGSNSIASWEGGKERREQIIVIDLKATGGQVRSTVNVNQVMLVVVPLNEE